MQLRGVCNACLIETISAPWADEITPRRYLSVRCDQPPLLRSSGVASDILMDGLYPTPAFSKFAC